MPSPLLLDREFLKTLEEVTLLCGTDSTGFIGKLKQVEAAGV